MGNNYGNLTHDFFGLYSRLSNKKKQTTMTNYALMVSEQYIDYRNAVSVVTSEERTNVELLTQRLISYFERHGYGQFTVNIDSIGSPSSVFPDDLMGFANVVIDEDDGHTWTRVFHITFDELV